MNLQTSNQRFKRRKIRYRKLIWVSILFYTLFWYQFQVLILFDSLSRYWFRNRYFSIPHRDTNFRYRYQGIDTGIDTSDTWHHFWAFRIDIKTNRNCKVDLHEKKSLFASLASFCDFLYQRKQTFWKNLNLKKKFTNWSLKF